MSPNWPALVRRLQDLTDERLPDAVPTIVEEIKSLPMDEKRELVVAAMRNRVTEIEEIKKGNRAHLALSIVLHATGVKTISSPTEDHLRREIEEKFRKLNGNPEDYRSLGWRSADGE